MNITFKFEIYEDCCSLHPSSKRACNVSPVDPRNVTSTSKVPNFKEHCQSFHQKREFLILGLYRIKINGSLTLLTLGTS